MPTPSESSFRHTLLLGDLPPDFPGDRFPLIGDPATPIPVPQLLDLAEALTTARPAVLITSHDLSLPGFASLLGYADRRRRLAVISTFRLGHPSQLGRRLESEMLHELGHLQGHRHCSQPLCVMHPVQESSQLDTRPHTLCSRCRSPLRRAAKPIAAAAFLSLLIVSSEFLLGRLLPPAPPSPFTCLTHDPAGRPTPGLAHAADIAHIHFRGRMLFCLRDRAGLATVRDRSLPLSRRLNDLWVSGRPPLLTVTATSPHSARVDANGQLLVDVLPGDALNANALATAHQWAGILSTALADTTGGQL